MECYYIPFSLPIEFGLQAAIKEHQKKYVSTYETRKNKEPKGSFFVEYLKKR